MRISSYELPAVVSPLRSSGDYWAQPSMPLICTGNFRKYTIPGCLDLQRERKWRGQQYTRRHRPPRGQFIEQKAKWLPQAKCQFDCMLNCSEPSMSTLVKSLNVCDVATTVKQRASATMFTSSPVGVGQAPTRSMQPNTVVGVQPISSGNDDEHRATGPSDLEKSTESGDDNLVDDDQHTSCGCELLVCAQPTSSSAEYVQRLSSPTELDASTIRNDDDPCNGYRQSICKLELVVHSTSRPSPPSVPGVHTGGGMIADGHRPPVVAAAPVNPPVHDQVENDRKIAIMLEMKDMSAKGFVFDMATKAYKRLPTPHELNQTQMTSRVAAYHRLMEQGSEDAEARKQANIPPSFRFVTDPRPDVDDDGNTQTTEEDEEELPDSQDLPPLEDLTPEDEEWEASKQFANTCLFAVLNQQGIPVQPRRDGPFWALRDGNEVLQEYGKCLLRVDTYTCMELPPGRYIQWSSAKQGHFLDCCIEWFGTSRL